MKFSKILIDGNNLYARNWYRFNNLSCIVKNKKLITGGIFGFIKSLDSIHNKFLSNNGTIYILFDNSNSKTNQRKELYSEYKENREEKSEEYFIGLDYLKLILLNRDEKYKLVYRQDYEADDFVLPLIKNFNYDKILCVSDDQDWARSIDNNIYWYAHNKIFDREKYYEKYGYYPDKNAVSIWKAFRGDKSDGIPIGVKGIPSKILNQIVNDFDDIYDVLDNFFEKEYITKKWKKEIKENKTNLRINYQLVDFLEITKEDFEESIYDCEFNSNTLRKLYTTLDFKISDIEPKLMTIFPKKGKNFFKQM